MEEGYDLKQREDGSYEMKRQDHRLHVGTGEEAEQQWPDIQEAEEAMPVLDLPDAWSKLITGEELPSDIKKEDDIISYNAKVMSAELKYHFLASTKNTKPATEVDSAVIEGSNDINQPENGEEESRPGHTGEGNSEAEEEDETDKRQPDGDPAHPKSVYGASILLKLQWEDKKPQKKVPHRTYDELGHFIGDTFKNLNEALKQNEAAGEAVVNVMAFDLTPLILARYMDGIETCTDVLAENAFQLLTVFVERGSPREIHLAIKVLLKHIDIVYLEASSYLLLKPLMGLWMKLILRMPRMRHKFVRDLLKEFDRMLSYAETYEVSFVPDEGGIGIEKEGRIKGMSEMILQFLEALTKLQVAQSEESEAINVEVDGLGRAKKRVTQSTEVSTTNGAIEAINGNPEEGTKSLDASSEKKTETEGENGDKKPEGGENGSKSEDGIGKETTDWVNERAVTLARAIQILGLLWADISPPPGEERDTPRKKMTSKKSEAAQARRKLRKEKKEMLFARCIRLFNGLGWSNPVLVCQIATNGLSIRGCSMTDDAFKEHIGEDIRSRSEKKNTLYSVNGIAHYLCGILRPKTRSLLSGTEGSNIDHYKYDIQDTGFELLDEKYAFDLVLPYAMALISLSDPTLLMAGILLLRTFLSRLPVSSFETYEEALRLRFGVNILGREANVLGLALHLVKAIAACDDPKHREFAYGTLRELLKRCSHPAVRYTISEYIFVESKRMAVTAQLVTDMKDAIRYSDDVAVKGTKKDWGMAQASALRTRFVEVCLPKYFLPQRSLLSCISPMVSTSNVCLFLACSDSQLLTLHEKDETLYEHIKHRRRFMKAYCKLGMECVRAFASVAEHDKRNVPKTKLTKENRNEAMALFAASEQTLNQSIAAICALSRALELLQ